MNTTINISLPKSMLADAKKILSKRGFTSISEYFRAAVRRDLYPRLTENGFTPEFEAQVLKAAAEPISKDKVWETEEDIREYFNNLEKKLKKRNGKGQTTR